MRELHDFLLRHPRLFVLTGAGISTDSGIPGYRDAQGAWQRTPPVQLQDFLGSHAARQRYWARSMVGWPIAAGAQPNAAHYALTELQLQGRLSGLVTQNVDGLHQRAGSTGVIELHGTIATASCLSCGEQHARALIQRELEQHNPDWLGLRAEAAADGDAHLESEHFGHFHVPVCRCCAGVLKPDVVFFGDSVPRERVQAATQALEAADAVLVVGSSLMVYSGYRFCVWAQRMGKPVAALNLGKTRADAMLALKVMQPCGPALSALVAGLAAPAA